MRTDNILLRRLKGRQVILFGASSGLEPILKKLDGVCSVGYIVDNDPQKWGRDFLGYRIYSPEKLFGKNDEDIVLVCSWWKKSISRQLLSYGLKPNSDFFIDSALAIDVSHYYLVFELYLKFLQKHRLPLWNKSILHVGVGQTLIVDILLALTGARVVACNLEDEMIFFPDVSLKLHLHETLRGYYWKNFGLFKYRLEEFLEFGADSLHINSDKIAFLVFDAEKIPFRDNSFDYVLSYDLFEHLRSPEGVINEQNRVMKPGSYFYHHISPSEHRAGKPAYDHYRYNSSQWDQICKEVGYFHNRWLSCQFIEAFSQNGEIRELEVSHGKGEDLPLPDFTRIDPLFYGFPEKEFLNSTGYMRIGGSAL